MFCVEAESMVVVFREKWEIKMSAIKEEVDLWGRVIQSDGIEFKCEGDGWMVRNDDTCGGVYHPHNNNNRNDSKSNLWFFEWESSSSSIIIYYYYSMDV
jgi:hypothetical protein